MTNRTSNEDPLREEASLDGLLLEFADLLPGDILLFRAVEPDALAQRVSDEIGSPYTHAAVYLGNGEIIEAGDPKIEKHRLSEDDKEDYIIGVLRSQFKFGDERIQALREFADALVKSDSQYDWRGIFKYKKTRTKFEEELQEIRAATTAKSPARPSSNKGRISAPRWRSPATLWLASSAILRKSPTRPTHIRPSISTRTRLLAGFLDTSRPTPMTFPKTIPCW
ncbi:hypothetical protein IVB38_22045 [Bradyrhizobium sp. 38]|uniref:hypothetical protein n=1 Tax=unclassified Bradyrhizobium TaxID=2631580 RepID=UPI001FF92E79|nr:MULTISPECIES: hypothetical protein [unclassified Bradyrhizobium]MCK1338619.1 hypothetical protein [Bradyrhizobium sp. 38]MCK1776025.1 hypothetical protein [Bradyrhizobium sp. 132]